MDAGMERTNLAVITPATATAIALVLIVAGRYLAPEEAESPMVIAGGLSIALAHVATARLCRLGSGCRTAAGSSPARALSGHGISNSSPSLKPISPVGKAGNTLKGND